MQRIALVTGSGRGIGLAIAQALLAREGAVAITATSGDRAQQAAARLVAEGFRPEAILPLECDVRDPSSVDAAFSAVEDRFGGLDVLVNNAGVGTGAPVGELSHDEWRRIVDTNLTGAFNCCKAALPRLRRRGGGWIISISSLASTNPFAGGAAYCAAKAGLNALSDALMQEVRHDAIRVSCVLPGSVATGFSGRTPSSGADWRLQPADVARVVVDLLAHDSRSLPSRVEIRPSRPQKS